MDLEIEVKFAKHVSDKLNIRITLLALDYLQASIWVLSYFLGYFQLSLAWFIIPAVLHLIRKHNDKRLLLRRKFVNNLIKDNEEEVISHVLPELPSWV